MKTVKIIADSTCDLGKVLVDKYQIPIIPLNIIMDDCSYTDGEEATPDDIYKWADAKKTTPKTAAVSIERAKEVLEKYSSESQDVIFFGISEDMSTTCNVLRLVSGDLNRGNVYIINSMNLSTGIGLQVLRAVQMAEAGMEAEKIVAAIEADRDKVRASFVVDTLTYLARGGRCNAVTALLANTLHLHPKIEVIDGAMQVNKKYRGNLEKAVTNYAQDMEKELLQADSQRVFITHSGCSEELIDTVRTYLESLNYFKEILVTRAGGVVSSHCGPGTLGVLYYMK